MALWKFPDGEIIYSLDLFFFQKGKNRQVPSVIKELNDELAAARLIAKNAIKRLYVNPEACQAVAGSAELLQASNYEICPAVDPFNRGRGLHAKFIFGFNMNRRSKHASGCWVYIGSGNLTEHGFLRRISRNGGNLEAGMLLSAKKLYWKRKRLRSDQPFIEDLLPVSLNSEEVHQGELEAGDQTIERFTYHAPPVSWLKWQPGEQLLIEEYLTGETYTVYSPDGRPCVCDEETTDKPRRWKWPWNPPESVLIKWGKGNIHSRQIPVLNELGFVNSRAESLGVTDIIQRIELFPKLAEGDETDEPDQAFEGVNRNGSTDEIFSSSIRTNSYPIRDLMILIEKIADRQTSMHQNRWGDWCDRLEQYLIAAADCDAYKIVSQMNLNPFSPLWRRPFRPSYAEDCNSVEGRQYEDALQRIEEKLNLNTRQKLI